MYTFRIGSDINRFVAYFFGIQLEIEKGLSFAVFIVVISWREALGSVYGHW